MRRFLAALMGCALPLTLAVALTACSLGPTVEVSQSQIATSFRQVLTGLEMSTSVYLANNPVSPEQQKKIDLAEQAADTFMDSLPTATTTDFPTVARHASDSLNAVLAILPPGALPASVTGGIYAFETLVNAIAPLIGNQGPIHPTLKLVR